MMQLLRRVAHEGKPTSQVRSLTLRLAATLPVWKRLHAAADQFAQPLQRIMMRALTTGRNAFTRADLLDALDHDEHKVEVVLDPAVSAFMWSLGASSKLEGVLLSALGAGGQAATWGLPGKPLRVSADNRKTPIRIKFNVVNPKAVDWAKTRSATLVTGVTETTRERIREIVGRAFEEDRPRDETADLIDGLFDDEDRALLIARTETMAAVNEGQRELWDQAVEDGFLTGHENQEWVTTDDGRLCSICEAMSGEQVGLGEEFDVDGELINGPPAHPNCRCVTGLALIPPPPYDGGERMAA